MTLRLMNTVHIWFPIPLTHGLTTIFYQSLSYVMYFRSSRNPVPFVHNSLVDLVILLLFSRFETRKDIHRCISIIFIWNVIGCA